MTSLAMITGMLPMALGLGAATRESAPLARAVIGGLLAATVSTLFVLPLLFTVFSSVTRSRTESLDPYDPASPFFMNQTERKNT
jgi:Cu/Ag efflux pump CusA